MVHAVILTLNYEASSMLYSRFSDVETVDAPDDGIFRYQTTDDKQITISEHYGSALSTVANYDYIVLAGTDDELAELIASYKKQKKNSNIPQKPLILFRHSSPDAGQNLLTLLKPYEANVQVVAGLNHKSLLDLFVAKLEQPAEEHPPQQADTNLNNENVAATPVAINNTKSSSLFGLSMQSFGLSNNKSKPDAVPGAWKTAITRIKSIFGWDDNKNPNEAANEIQAMHTEHATFKAALQRIYNVLTTQNKAVETPDEAAEIVENLVKKQKAAVANNNQQEVSSLKAKIDTQGIAIEQQKNAIADLNATIQERDDTIAGLQDKLSKLNTDGADDLLNALKLNWNNPEHLEFWQKQTSRGLFGNGGYKLIIAADDDNAEKIYILPARIGYIISELRSKKTLTKAVITETVDNIRKNKKLSSVYGGLGRSSVTTGFYDYKTRQIIDEANTDAPGRNISLQKHMDAQYKKWEAKKQRRNKS